jgi:hypothetical protein
LLAAKLARVERPQAVIQTGLQETQVALKQLVTALEQTGLPRSDWDTKALAQELIDYAHKLESLVRSQQLDLLEPGSPRSLLMKDLGSESRQASEVLDSAQAKTKYWRRKLAPEELEIALAQAKRMEGSWLARLTPGWWRLRRIMHECYDFSQHIVRPSWPQVLGFLQAEYTDENQCQRIERRARDQFGFAGPLAIFSESIEHLRQVIARLPAAAAELHARVIANPAGASKLIEPLLAAGQTQVALRQASEKFLVGGDTSTLDELSEELNRLERKVGELPKFLPALEVLDALPPKVASAVREIPLEMAALGQEIADATLEKLLNAEPALSRFSVRVRDRAAEHLEQQIDRWQEANAEVVRQQVRGIFLKNVKRTSEPGAAKTNAAVDFAKRYSRGRRELEHEFGKSMRYRSIRDLVEGDTALVVRDLKPVWLMSPLSVSDTLPLAARQFDVVIFDEASQVTLEEAIPCIFRAPQAIVVGDEMQLPPTSFFATKRDEDEDALMIEDEGETVEYSLDSNSLLNHAGRNLASTMLGWHYRSRSESLISFSNWAFYEGRLMTVPEEQVSVVELPEILVAETTAGAQHVADLLARPLSFHRMNPGYYEKRRNRTEADYIAELVRGLLASEQRASIGIIAFSEAQQSEIENALERLAEGDETFRQQLDAEYEREEDGQFVGLLVKNLENIQGDERDVVILSVCYGRDRNGRMLMNFGPINQSGGEKRLNVAFSRSKKHMAVVSSIQYTDITNDHNDGANCLKNYLRYVAASSVGSAAVAEQVLHDLARWRGRAEEAPANEPDAVADSLASALEERGYIVDRNVGQSLFRCDLAVRKNSDVEYRMGILVDTPRYFRQRNLLERDMMKPRLLRAFGWRVAYVISKDWYANREEVLDGLLEKLKP